IPADLRRLMRYVQEFAPRSGTTTRALALHVHFTENKSKKAWNCRWHDGTHGKHKITGVPYGQGTQDIKHNILTCGCEIKTALLDFFWWKTWVADSVNPDVDGEESLCSEVLEPRWRHFFATAFTEGTLLHIADLYSRKTVYGSKEYSDKLTSIQLDR
ncbi:hypothetical protein C8J57DRAFT_1024409, partial [Mycena rebaudengoi]